MTLSLIWAIANNRVIGIENRLPWKLPADMKWFRQNTLGKPIIMGRLTFESFGAKPLPGRRNIIISRNPDYQIQSGVDIEVHASLQAALAATAEVEEVMLIGGMSLYQQALPLAQRLYMTRIHADIDGDAWFPEIDFSQWHTVEQQDFSADEKNPLPYSFSILEPA